MNTTDRILGEAIGDNPSGFDPNMGVTELIMSTFPQRMPSPPVGVHLPGHRAKRYTLFREQLIPELVELAKDLDYTDYLQWAMANNQDVSWI